MKAVVNTTSKLSEFAGFLGPYFPRFELYIEIYRVNIGIQCEYGNITTRKNVELR